MSKRDDTKNAHADDDNIDDPTDRHVSSFDREDPSGVGGEIDASAILYVVRTPVGGSMSVMEQELFDLVDGERAVADIAIRLGLTIAGARRIASALLARGVLGATLV